MSDWMFLLLMEAANALATVRAEHRATFFVDRWALACTTPAIRTVRWTREALEQARLCADLREMRLAA